MATAGFQAELDKIEEQEEDEEHEDEDDDEDISDSDDPDGRRKKKPTSRMLIAAEKCFQKAAELKRETTEVVRVAAVVEQNKRISRFVQIVIFVFCVTLRAMRFYSIDSRLANSTSSAEMQSRKQLVGLRLDRC